jgi:hypothetical protein
MDYDLIKLLAFALRFAFVAAVKFAAFTAQFIETDYFFLFFFISVFFCICLQYVLRGFPKTIVVSKLGTEIDDIGLAYKNAVNELTDIIAKHEKQSVIGYIFINSFASYVENPERPLTPESYRQAKLFIAYYNNLLLMDKGLMERYKGRRVI